MNRLPNYNYSPEELRRMQEEAARRVREMQRQARARLEGGQPAPPQEPPRLSPPVPPKRPPAPPPSPPPAGLDGLMGQLGMLGGDSDRAMLLLLLFLLSRQGSCSPGLIAALFWLMMG